MASRRPVLLNHPESLCPARLPAPTWSVPRASRGLCRGAFRDPARNVVLLTPSISLRLIQALSYTQVTRETPRIPVFAFNSLRTLSFSVSYKSCVCHSYANRRGVYQQFPTWNESLAACNRIQVLSFHTLPHSFALVKNSTLFFSCSSTLFAQNTRRGGRAPAAFLKKNLNSSRITRGIKDLHSLLDAGLACRSDPPGNLEQQHQRYRSSKHIDPNQPRRNLGLRRSSRPCRIAKLRRRRGFCACHGLFGRWSFVRLAKFAGYHRLRVVHTHPPFFLYSHHPSTSLLL